MNCKNCGQEVAGKYCANCGQKASVGPINFKEIAHEFWHNLTHTDKGFLQLAAHLFLRPGLTVREYLDGRRKKYFSPFTFYLVSTSLLLLVSARVFKREDAVYAINNEFGNYVAKELNYILIFALPVTTCLLWAFFRKQFRTLAESFVVMIFAFGLLNFYLLFANLFFLLFIDLHYNYNGWAVLLGYLLVAYLLFAFLRPKTFWQFIKWLLLIVLFYLLVEFVGKRLALYFYGVPFQQVFGF